MGKVDLKLPPNIDLAATMEALEKTGIGQTELRNMSPSAANAIINNFAVFKGRKGPRGPGRMKEAYGGKIKKCARGGGVRKAKRYS